MNLRPLACFFLGASALLAADAPNVIDLPTALRLAGAKSIEVEIAREKVTEARAANDAARQKYFPWITPAITFRRHENNIQNVEGRILDADKQSLSAGVTFTAQVDLGETYFQNLVARQLTRSSEAALATRQREATYRAAAAYFELARARGAVSAATDAAGVARRHAEQLTATAAAGLAFQGDVARIVALRERSDLAIVRLRAEQRIAAARLADVLRLDPTVELLPAEADLVPLTLVAADGELGALVAHALATRPELDETAARLEAARAARRGASQAPLIPTLGAQAGFGGLGGGTGTTSPGHDFDTSRDYMLGVSWRVGPGGLFDRARQREATSREKQVELALEKARDTVRREVVEQHTRLRSLGEQLALSRKALEASDQSARLSRERRTTGVSAVLEDLQAEEELARARRDYLATVADYNQAQYALRFATGD